MLVRETQKKIDNVSIITLKKFNKKYEVAVYPNKLYEYRHDPNIPLETILHSDQIFRNVSTGEVCSEQELSLFGLPRNDIIHTVLKFGHEQKPKETNQYELENIERQIVDLIQNKVLYNGTYVSSEILLKFIRSVWTVKNDDPKKQVSSIIKRLEDVGFERVTFRVKCDSSLVDFPNVEKEGDSVILKSDVLHDFIEYCDSKGIPYIITRNEEVEEEEIC